uniref:Uncharacterized protein n=1 Tax=Arcella intermedia TaxID=1963864 RepID=A0A6B2LWZ3_9EUKA
MCSSEDASSILSTSALSTTKMMALMPT